MAEFFKKLHEISNLEEGMEGIRSILLSVYRRGSISIKRISRETKIPIPAVSKICNILEERKMVNRSKGGVQFWDNSMEYIEEFFGFSGYGFSKCPKCNNRPVYITPRYEEYFDILKPIFEERPQVNTQLDQSKNTIETAIQRALYLYENGALEGKHIIFLGDDDFTSVAVGLLYTINFPDEPKLIPKSITVIDIDERILEKIKEVFESHNLEVRCIKHDLREPLLNSLNNKFDTVITDPPYTTAGLELFLKTACQLLHILDDPKFLVGKDILLSYAHRSSDRTLEFQSIINKFNLAIMEIIPGFNKYEGAEILGNITQMIHLKSTQKTVLIDYSKEVLSDKIDKIYTIDSHPYIKKYQCISCENIFMVGPDQEFLTIEILKGQGCPKCDDEDSNQFRLIERNLNLSDK